jgi:hypothetical protein
VDQQRYISPDLTHFVGAALPDQRRQFALLKKIIHTGVLQAMPRFGRLPNVSQHAKFIDGRADRRPLRQCARDIVVSSVLTRARISWNDANDSHAIHFKNCAAMV